MLDGQVFGSFGRQRFGRRRRGIETAPTIFDLPTAPTVRWAPQFSAITTSGGRVVTATDSMGIAPLTDDAVGTGPLALTDTNGRKFWRFNGSQRLSFTSALTYSSRNYTVFMIGRQHRGTTNNRILCGYDVPQPSLEVATQGGSAPFPRAGRIITAQTGREKMMVGSEMSLIGAACGATAIRYFVDGAEATTTQGNLYTIAGGEIGRFANTPETPTYQGLFDLYELVVYNRKLTDTEARAVRDTLLDHYGIVEKTNQIVFDGDSITQSISVYDSGKNCAMILSDPAVALPRWKYVNIALSGSQVPDLVSRRDEALASWADQRLLGQNVLAVEVGTNDLGNGAQTPAQTYARIVNYLNTTTTGVLQRGWTVRQLINIASRSTSKQADLEVLRGLLRASTFLDDTLTNTGQTYAGKLSRVELPLITVGGQTIFSTVSDASNTFYYNSEDGIHPTEAGAVVRALGGDTPQYGIAYGLT
ncbi:hypothetical protein P775_08500 [Puniceibacterium antarcticum]|uniref:Uncharacterized protein n=1 Tax=Puniceibacterium antarcticum TaxID=1206336 RepID=A0A2G8RG98_9RHOB|nr:SGNH/GDSL hydrolase family protein [Puniceibacterium antarcticum]PIL20559.1 hypothetical protein P775_08500 [Puniceibacterium antarcticum]